MGRAAAAASAPSGPGRESSTVTFAGRMGVTLTPWGPEWKPGSCNVREQWSIRSDALSGDGAILGVQFDADGREAFQLGRF